MHTTSNINKEILCQIVELTLQGREHFRLNDLNTMTYHSPMIVKNIILALGTTLNEFRDELGATGMSDADLKMKILKSDFCEFKGGPLNDLEW